jgi:hypothetical protein
VRVLALQIGGRAFLNGASDLLHARITRGKREDLT